MASTVVAYFLPAEIQSSGWEEVASTPCKVEGDNDLHIL